MTATLSNMEWSEQAGELFGALATAQGAMTAASKDATVKEKRKTKDGREFDTSRTYADLASALEATRPHLSANGIAIIQAPGKDERGNTTVTTVLGHTSGQWVRCITSSNAEGLQQRGVQADGSLITYLRRYSLMAVCGIAPDDDDGTAAVAAMAQPRKPEPRKPAPKPKEAQADTAARQAEHDPEWAGDRATFCAELGKLGLEYDQLKAYLAGLEQPRSKPSVIGNEGRRKLMAWLQGPGAAKVQAVAQ